MSVIGRPGRRIVRGFSLVELLVVLGVVALLLGLLLPTLGRARDRRQMTACLSNLRQLASAFVLYAHDHDGYGPDEMADQTWDALLWPYLSDESTYACPADADGFYQNFDTSYEWRDSFQVDFEHPERALSLTRLLDARPASLVLVFEAAPGWHERGRRNAAALNGAARAYDEAAFQDNLKLKPY